MTAEINPAKKSCVGVVKHPIPQLLPPLFKALLKVKDVTVPPFLPLKPSDVLPHKIERIVVSDAAMVDEVYAIAATSFPVSFMFGPITSVATNPFPVAQSVPFAAVETGLKKQNADIGEFPVPNELFGSAILSFVPSNVIPSVPQVGPLVKVPLKIPSPPREYAVVPVPEF